MKKLTIVLIIIFGLSCSGGERQEILLNNKSNSNIYYCIHRNDIPDTLDINSVRPWTVEMIKEHHKNLVFENRKDSLDNALALQKAFLIKKDDTEIIFASRGVKIYNNKIPVKERIKYEYDGKMCITLIKEDIMNKFSSKEIIEKKLYYSLKPLTEKDILKNTTELVFK